MITPLMPFARASSPHCFQYVAEVDSSPNIIVEPWLKKWTGVGAIVVVVVVVVVST